MCSNLLNLLTFSQHGPQCLTAELAKQSVFQWVMNCDRGNSISEQKDNGSEDDSISSTSIGRSNSRLANHHRHVKVQPHSVKFTDSYFCLNDYSPKSHIRH